MTDNVRLCWAQFHDDFWLDIYGVGRRDRRDLRRELAGNLRAAPADVGMGRAPLGLGGLRRLAHESSRGIRRSSWSAGISAGLVAAALSLLAFFLLSLHYAEGVLDSGVGRPMSSWLSPFVGPSVEVHDQGGAGIGVTMGPGVLPSLLGLVAFVAVAKPWRALRRS
ncbi:MAG: hypothetical protein OEY70_14230 [Acidimicrobiia bacterium]|nr:hypothetical protein [Acidimicrobiia bacterium]